MKTVIAIRGGQVYPLIKKNDTFDSKINIFNNHQYISDVPYVNTDFCNGYNGGILSEGDYAFKCGIRRDNGKKVLYLFNKDYLGKFSKTEYITKESKILKSLIPNPNHKGLHIITNVLLHSDSENGGWSHGCMTVYPTYYKSFIDMFEIDEEGLFMLRRQSGWLPKPEIYRGN